MSGSFTLNPSVQLLTRFKTYDSTAWEFLMPTRLSALTDLLIADLLRSLYLSSHSLEMA